MDSNKHRKPDYINHFNLKLKRSHTDLNPTQTALNSEHLKGSARPSDIDAVRSIAIRGRRRLFPCSSLLRACSPSLMHAACRPVYLAPCERSAGSRVSSALGAINILLFSFVSMFSVFDTRCMPSSLPCHLLPIYEI